MNTKETIEKIWSILNENSIQHAKNLKDIQAIKKIQRENSILHTKGLKDIQAIKKIQRENSILHTKGLKDIQAIKKIQRENSILQTKNLKDIQSLRKSQQELTMQIKETDRQMKETDRQMKETDKHLREKFSDLKDYVGNVGKNNGAVAESFFYNTLAKTMKLDRFTFDFIEPNVERINRRQNMKGEYDIVLTNSTVIVIVETKYKVHPNDIKKFKEKKLPMFRKLFPDKKNYILYGAIAGMAFPSEIKEMALEQGLFVLTQGKGNITVEKSDIQDF